MQRLGIPARPPSQPKYPLLHDRQWIAEQIDAGRSPAQIAAEVGCDRMTVVAALRAFRLRWVPR